MSDDTKTGSPNLPEVSQIIEEAMPDVREIIRKSMVERISESLQWSMREKVKSEVEKFFEEQLAPDIAEQLGNMREELRGQVVLAVADIGANLRTKMAEKAAGISDYKIGQVLRDLI